MYMHRARQPHQRVSAHPGGILDRAGPGAFNWMSDIAAQLAFLGAAQINGVATNVNIELGESATAEDVVHVVVRP